MNTEFSFSEDDEYWDNTPKSHIRLKKRYAPDGVHVPNKNEGQLLRKLMAETGLSEDEIRSHKTYRRKLSDAQKVPPAKLSKREKAQRNLMKSITKRLKLAKEHPTVQAEFKQLWQKNFANKYW